LHATRVLCYNVSDMDIRLCLQCGHKWTVRNGRLNRCPRCRSRYWNERRVDAPTCVAAHRMVSWALQEGRIEHADHCARCGDRGRVVGHHPDYSDPLRVVWLCPTCHANEHRKRVYHLTESTCKVCGEQFLGNARRIYCSNRCKCEAHRPSRAKQRAHAASQRKRDAAFLLGHLAATGQIIPTTVNIEPMSPGPIQQRPLS
jgi:DNA-directed RNA polymerase subunit RPC12/RpoP